VVRLRVLFVVRRAEVAGENQDQYSRAWGNRDGTNTSCVSSSAVTVTALAGMVAKRFGPEVGGLFLAFPAIFPATATLIEKHEKQKREHAGTERGRAAAGADAAGAAMGSIGLAAFAVIIWQTLPNSSVSIVLTGATLVWLVVSVLVWELRQRLRRRARTSRLHASSHSIGRPSTKQEVR
jgi:hypothetical protein